MFKISQSITFVIPHSEPIVERWMNCCLACDDSPVNGGWGETSRRLLKSGCIKLGGVDKTSKKEKTWGA